MAIDYKNLREITITTQEGFNSIPDDFEGRIYIWSDEMIVVDRRFSYSIIAQNNSSVVARNNSSVAAWGNSSVVAYNNSSVEAWGNSSVVARENSSVVARENSSVVAWENSSVEAWGNSSVTAWDNSSVTAWGNVQVTEISTMAKIKINGNARIVYMPKTINEFMDFYGIKHTKTKATFYKAVRFINGKFCANQDNSFVYEIGGTKNEMCDLDVSCDCSNGIHIAYLDWALRYGADWDNLKILEVETKIKDIVLPLNSDGKVRTSEVKVIREVPLEECGVYGRILANRK